MSCMSGIVEMVSLVSRRFRWLGRQDVKLRRFRQIAAFGCGTLTSPAAEARSGRAATRTSLPIATEEGRARPIRAKDAHRGKQG